MISIIKKPVAFIKRELIAEASYKFSFLSQFPKIFFSVLTFFFLSKLIGDFGAPHLDAYGGSYFAFVLIGVAFQGYISVSMSEISQIIREGQMLGTLETLLMTQTSVPTIIFSSSLYSYIWSTFRVGVYIFLGAFIFGVDIQNTNLISAFVILILTITAFSGLGIISASFVMIFKRGDPISWIIGAGSTLLGGLYYPISVLPAWLQKFSYIFPITYSLEGMRLAVLKGYSLSELKSIITMLMGFSVLILPICILIFQYAVKKAKMDGTLTHY